MTHKPKATISAAAFKEALLCLGWTFEQAAKELGVASRHRIGDWASGRRPVPPYVAAHLKRVVDIHLKRRGL